MDINKFKNLIDDFNKLPKSEKILPTYLEISGQPHFENVCSNILAFYFNTNECHGFKDLVLKSFIECIDENLLDEYDIDTVNIERELYVNDKKRMDIIIECNNIVFAIENKIYHILNNELNTYQISIEELYPDKKHEFIVLSLKEENEMFNSKFINITYSTFFAKLKQHIGYYFVNSNNQYTTFFIDFIKTIENLTNNQNMNKAYFNFFIENKTEIENLIKENNILKSNLHSKVNSIYSLLPEKNEVNNCKKRSTYLKYVIYYDFEFYDDTIALDIIIDFNRVQVLIWTRNSKSGNGKHKLIEKLELLKVNRNLKKNNEGRFIVYEEDILFTEIIPEVLVSKVNEILALIKIV